MDELPEQSQIDREQLLRWSKRLHLVMTVGGGFLGFCSVIQEMANGHGRQAAGWVTLAIFAIVYLFGLVGGLRYNESVDKWRPLLAYYLIQIPIITSPSFSYFFTSGFALALGLQSGKANLNGSIGSSGMFTFHQMQPLGIAINLVPLILVVLLFRVNSRRNAELDESTS